MTAGAYYNEHDEFAAQWLRNLIAKDQIAPGDVDTRSIDDVSPDDLRGYSQCHFFAGIGVWSYALRRAGWSDDRPVWTGSCPCQSFSAAGQRGGFNDERHLWPSFFHLIEECRPGVVFGEQVASKDALAWVDLVQADMEGAHYAFAAIDLCAAGFGAPHIRQRLYWVADTAGIGRGQIGEDLGGGVSRSSAQGRTTGSTGCSGAILMGNAYDQGLEGRVGMSECAGQRSSGKNSVVSQLADADGWDASAEGLQRGWQQRQQLQNSIVSHNSAAAPTNGLWRDVDWLFCRDGKWRPVRPGSFPLVTGASGRVGRLRAYGNALNAAQAQGFIEAYLEIMSTIC